MPSIHLIKKHEEGLPQIEKVEGEENAYTSGYWTLSEQTAQSLIGGKIYFHEKQREPSYFGGKIIEANKISEGDYKGKIIFKFVFSAEFKDVRTEASGWAQEMKIVQ